MSFIISYAEREREEKRERERAVLRITSNCVTSRELEYVTSLRAVLCRLCEYVCVCVTERERERGGEGGESR